MLLSAEGIYPYAIASPGHNSNHNENGVPNGPTMSTGDISWISAGGAVLMGSLIVFAVYSYVCKRKSSASGGQYQPRSGARGPRLAATNVETNPMIQMNRMAYVNGGAHPVRPVYDNSQLVKREFAPLQV